MSELSDGSARLLRDARELLGPEPDTLSNMARAVDAKLKAGAGLSCGDLEPTHFSGKLAWRSLFGARAVGVAVGLLALGGTAYFGLSAREVAQLARSADVPQPSAAEATDPGLQPLSDRVEPALPSSHAQGPSAAAANAPRKRNRRATARASIAPSAPAPNHLHESSPATAHAANSGMIQAAFEPSHDGAAQSANEHHVNPHAASAEQVSPERDLLVREVAMIERARAALGRGDEARALTILDAHAREFPAGTLAEEQLALRARALCASGQFEAGREVVRRLAARGPQSPHLRNSVALCGSAE